MKVYSVKTNFVLNAFRVLSATIIGISTMPYINRTLGPENLGKVEFVNTIISYFVLFSALGIPMYGIREVAKLRSNKNECDKLVLELICILLITTLVSYLVLFLGLYSFNLLVEYDELLLILSSIILLSNISVEWYFQGMENQFYITVRFVIVRLVSLFVLFICVKSTEDYLYYAFFLVLITAGSGFFNLFYVLNDVKFSFSKIKSLKIKRHLKGILTIFIAAVSVNIYLHLDNLLLGNISGDSSVGFYAVANKLVRYAISFIIILGSVLLPRLVSLYTTDKEKYYSMLENTFYILMLISIPFSIYFFFMAKEIIFYMAGVHYFESVLTIKLLSPLCFTVALAYFLGYLVLYSQGKEKAYTIAVIVSAIFSVVVNYFMIPYFDHYGVAVVAVLSEIIAVFIMIIFVRKQLKKIAILNRNTFKIVFVSVLTCLVCLLVDFVIVIDTFLFFLTYTILFFLLYFGLLIFVNEKISSNVINMIYGYLKKIIK